MPFIFKIILFIHRPCWVFIAVWSFSSCGERGLLSICAWASHCGGFSCCGPQALGWPGFSSCSSQALEHRFNSCGTWVSCSEACGIFSYQGSNPCLLHWQMDCLPLCYCCRKADPFQGPKLGSGLTLGNELSEETHVLTKQEILSGKGTQVESSRVREPRRTALPCGSQSQVLW